MDELLKALLPMREEKIKNIWDHGIFVLDTNVLLNLYKYSNSTREELFETFDSIKNRLWIPHQVAMEFIYNRNKKINEQREEFKSHLKAFEKASEAAKKEINSTIDQNIKKPFRRTNTSNLYDRIDNFFNELKEELKEENDELPDFQANDTVLNKFYDLFTENIGPAYSSDELEKLYEEAEERYVWKQPPGYEDNKKKGEFKLFGNTLIKSEYGDFILWKQIIDKSLESNSEIVFITDDKKSDWWREENGKLLGPRLELINEFLYNTKNDFLMYTTERFLEQSQKMLNTKITKEALNEIYNKNLKNKNKEQVIERLAKISNHHLHLLDNINRQYNEKENEEDNYYLRNEMDNNRIIIEMLKKELKHLEEKLITLQYNYLEEKDTKNYDIENINLKKKEIMAVQNEMDKIDKELIDRVKMELHLHRIFTQNNNNSEYVT